MVNDSTGAIAEGRAAPARGAWAHARVAFVGALREVETPERVRGLGIAARYELDAAAAFAAHERGYRLARAGEDAAVAARLAIQLAYDAYAFRGKAEASGWVQLQLPSGQRSGRGPECADCARSAHLKDQGRRFYFVRQRWGSGPGERSRPRTSSLAVFMRSARADRRIGVQSKLSWPCGRILTPSSNATNGVRTLRGGRLGLLVWTAGPACLPDERYPSGLESLALRGAR